MIPIPAILGIAALVLSLGASLYALKSSYESNGKLQVALTTATTRLTEINNAVKERDKIDGTIRALPDDKLFDGLRQ
jgi:hypothetical protein